MKHPAPFTELQQEGDATKQHTVVPRDKNSLLGGLVSFNVDLGNGLSE